MGTRSGALTMAVAVTWLGCWRPVTDGGAVEAGVPDAGPPRPTWTSCEGVEASVHAPWWCCDGGTGCPVQFTCGESCAPCAAATPCAPGWSCEWIRAPYCEGECRRRLSACPPDLAMKHLTLDAVHSWVWQLAWTHDLDLDRHLLSCSVRDEATGRVTSLGTGDAGQVDWAALRTASCLRDSDLLAVNCRTHGAGVHVRPDADGGFWFSLTGAIAPPPAFERAAVEALRGCAAVFRAWDGGVYPYTF